jgi:hypothetical protein
VAEDSSESSPQSINILTLHFKNLKAVSLKGPGQFVALKILGRMPRNGDVVVI